MISNSILWLTVLIKQAINMVMVMKRKRKTNKHHTQLGLLAEGPSIPIWATCLTSVGSPICISGSFSSAKLSMCSYSTSFTREHLKSYRFSNAENSHFPWKQWIMENFGYSPNILEMYLKPLKRPFIFAVNNGGSFGNVNMKSSYPRWNVLVLSEVK